MKKNLKKLLSLAVVLALCVSLACAEETETFRSLTKIDETQALLDAGVTIEKIYYTDGYGFSTSEFTTEDEGEIALLWTALNKITVSGAVDEDITDWYPQIVLFLSDGSHCNVCFDAHWLEIGGRTHYGLENDEDFWTLTAALVQKYQKQEP